VARMLTIACLRSGPMLLRVEFRRVGGLPVDARLRWWCGGDAETQVACCSAQSLGALPVCGGLNGCA
jgi:hypothetical protein